MDCAKITVRIGGRRVEALIDSCASISLISYDFANKNGFKIDKVSRTKIVSIFGSTAKVKGKSTFRVFIGPHTYRCKALVLENSMYPLLLGLDWLVANRCNINFDNRVLEFPNGAKKPISIKKEEFGVLPVRSVLEVNLKGGERAIIPIKIPDLYKVENIDGIVINLKNSDSPWSIAKALIKVNNGKSIAEITNLGKGPWKVCKNQQIGWFEYEPRIANAILIASAVEMEDVPLNRNSEENVHKSTSLRPNQVLDQV